MKYIKQIHEALQEIEDCFAENELAYLALTSKIELPIRDRLAYLLYKKSESVQDLLISREWKRFDLALLENSAPSLILEAKAMYSFDMFTRNGPNIYPSKIQNDVEKFAKYSSANTENSVPEFYTLLLATHPNSPPQRSLDIVVKYNRGINNYKPPSKNEFLKKVDEYFHKHKQYASGEIKGGIAFGVDVSVFYWIFGPYHDLT